MIVPRAAPFSVKEVFILDVSKFRKRVDPKPIQPVESDPGQENWVPEAGRVRRTGVGGNAYDSARLRPGTNIPGIIPS